MDEDEEIACDEEGCCHPPGYHKWEIEPNPYGNGFSGFVTDDDQQAADALQMLWDQMEPGELVIKVRLRAPAQPAQEKCKCVGMCEGPDSDPRCQLHYQYLNRQQPAQEGTQREK